MDINTSKLIEVLDSEAGKIRTTTINQNDAQAGELSEAKLPYPRDLYGNVTIDPLKVSRQLSEASGELTVANFPDLLRSGVTFDVFSGFNETPTVYEQIVRTVPSSKQQEEYADDAGLGLPPIVLEGQEYPTVAPSIGGGKIIRNYKRGFLLEVTEEIQRFDMWGKVRDSANSLGRALRRGRDQAVFDVLTTTANYNVLNLNDQGGNNYQTLAFSPTNLNLALQLMITQKDRTSGDYIGVSPDTLVCGPLLENFVRMLFTSPNLMRVGGNATNDTYGGGTNNPFYGAITKILVSPRFGASYQWALLDTRKAIYFQNVDGVSVQTESAGMQSDSWVRRDTIRYKARDWYGVGMRDDRFAFYSDSTSAPVAS